MTSRGQPKAVRVFEAGRHRDSARNVDDNGNRGMEAEDPSADTG